MRLGIVFVALVAVVGCSSEPVAIDGTWTDGAQPWGEPEALDAPLAEARDNVVTPVSTVSTPTLGVAFDLSGLLARVGMSGVTCNVDPAEGVVTTDFDLPGDGEVVVDGNGVNAVVSTSQGLYLHGIGTHSDPSTPLVEVESAPVEEGWRIEGAALVEGGVVAVHNDFGDCSMHFGPSDVWLDVPTACPEDLSADREDQAVWFAGRDGVFRVDENGGAHLGPADHVDWDASTQQAYLADGTVLRAIGLEGVELWSIDLEWGIVDVESVGDRGMVAVLVNGFPEDRVAIFDADGELVGATTHGETGRELIASPDGSRLALRLSGGVTFFDVE